MDKKKFYEDHRNFSWRTPTEYLISPGIRCKFDLLKEHLGSNNFYNGIDLGCSGNSFLYFLPSFPHKSFFDLAYLPLKQYLGNCSLDSKNDCNSQFFHPLCGDITHLPFRDKSFDFLSALDVLEHVENDDLAIMEISRILKENGIAIITVPHRMRYYTSQDRLIGHYRRYNIEQLYFLFEKYNLINLKTFGVYGKLMKIGDVQSSNPQKIESSLIKLRRTYATNSIFRKFWDLFVLISGKIMKIDAKYHSLKKMMNIGLIFKKQ